MSFIVLLIAHLLGDFIFQSSSLAKKKSSSIKALYKHCAIYSFFVFSSVVWFGSLLNIIIVGLLISLTHGFIDYSRLKLDNASKFKVKDHKGLEFNLFCADQLLHILTLIIASHFIKGLNFLGLKLYNVATLHISDKNIYNIIIIVLLYTICLSPAAVLIKKVMVLFSFQSHDAISSMREELIKTGYLIGILERIIILTLGLNGQVGAIGFVIAAKSLARFSQLNDRDFAEKYLVGTLLSATIALFCIVIGNTFILK